MKIIMPEEMYYALEESYSGICIGCGCVRHGDTEPDARKYPCECCEENKVYGMAEFIIRGIIEFVYDKPDFKPVLQKKDVVNGGIKTIEIEY
jgi:hypothetical protein